VWKLDPTHPEGKWKQNQYNIIFSCLYWSSWNDTRDYLPLLGIEANAAGKGIRETGILVWYRNGSSYSGTGLAPALVLGIFVHSGTGY
jgi:hypothetical protein